MSVLPVGISGEAQYQISRSLRFNSADSAYLNRTPASAGNRKTWTWSGWVKRGALGTTQNLLNAGVNSLTTGYTFLAFVSDALRVLIRDSGGAQNLITTAVYRDPCAWYHVVLAVDTTQATAANRRKLYVNGVEVTAFSTNDTVAQNTDTSVNNTVVQRIGNATDSAGVLENYLNGYLTEVNFIDGQALTPSSFGETDPITGVWKPKKYTGTYGTNGFYLNFSDNSGTTATTLGKDYSGNGNNWTPNNFSVTAGAGNDSLVDVPTLWGSDTGVGGEVRGNYATWNPLYVAGGSPTLANGNLDVSATTSKSTFATIHFESGKYYSEFTLTTAPSSGWAYIGVASPTSLYVYRNSDGNFYDNSNYVSYGASYTTNDVIGVAIDVDAGKLTFYKNGVSQGEKTGLSFGVNPAFFVAPTTASASGAFSANFGQRPFAYTAPSGFKALCTTNLPDSAVKKGSDQFNVVLDTGANIKTASEALFPSNYFEWIKDRANANNHQLIDIVRGSSAVLQSNTTAAETTYSAPSGNSVGWVWKGGGTGVTNTAGTITSTVSANTTSGFSIGTYTGNASGAAASIGHGLGVAPKLIITKGREAQITGSDNWLVWHGSFGAGEYLVLNGTNAKATSASYFGNTVPTSSLFYVGGGASNVHNESGKNYVAHCFAEVAGFSRFGSYTGNGSADGPMVYLGFRPRWILLKRTDSADAWRMYDTARNTYNVMNTQLEANASSAEGSFAAYDLDVVANGFKHRGTGGQNINGATYVYAAFAEHPFRTALAR